MAPDISSSTHIYNGNTDISKNLTMVNASSIRLNPTVSSSLLQRIDNSLNIIGQGIKCKSKMYDCVRVALEKETSEFSLAVTPTRIPYFGLNQGNLVANTKPQRVIYIVSAEREELAGRQDGHDPSGSTTQMKIVSDPYLLTDKDTILINCDIDMERAQGNSVKKSKEFGDVTVSYSYNWDVHGESNNYPEGRIQPYHLNGNRAPLQQSGGIGSRFLVISSVPTEKTMDKRNNVHNLTSEFYGISPSDDKTAKENDVISFGYVSYHSLGGKTGVNDDLKRLNSPHGYLFPKSYLVANKNASVFDDNWFDDWVTAYGDLANALQGKSEAGSGNFALKMHTDETLAFSKVVNQSAVVNTNFLKKLLYIKQNTYLRNEDNVKIYITVVEDWVKPANALDSYGAVGTVNGAAYIPYLDVNASRQIVAPDYDIWDNGESSNPTGTILAQGNYNVSDGSTGTTGESRSNYNTMVPHQGLNKITAFPKWGQVDILSDSDYEVNKDMILFDWRAKTLAQPTFACCDLNKITDLGEKSTCVRIDQYAGSFISNEFTYSGENNSDYILDANSHNIYEAQDAPQEGNVKGEEGSRSYVADKNTYVHAIEKIHNQFSEIGNKIVPGKLLTKFDNNKIIFKNNTFQLNKEPITVITSRYSKIPWFTWEGLSLPVGSQSIPKQGDIRCILTKKAVTALVSIIRTASLLVTGMVMNHELEFKSQSLVDVITNKTLYIAHYNTKQFFQQLDNIPISSIFNPEITEDYAHSTIAMPSWLEVLKQSSNVKIAQFFRSKFCNNVQLTKLIGPTDIFDKQGTLGDGDDSLNYPPDFTINRAEAQTPKLGVKNIPDPSGTLRYYDISFMSRNQVEYPDADGNDYEDDMWRYDQLGQASPGSTNNTLLRGLLRPIIWDPSGTYPNHALIPKARRNQKLGNDWEKLAYISSEGTLRNNGNCLQKSALNYKTVDEDGNDTNSFSNLTAALMYCTPYVPVGQIRIADPRSTSQDASTGYQDAELYRSQDIDPTLLNSSNNSYDAIKSFKLDYGTSTSDISSSTLFTKTTQDYNCGPPIIGSTTRQCTLASGTVIPKGIGFNNGENNEMYTDIDEIKIDLARDRRRLSLHTIKKGFGGKGLYERNNNMAIGPLTWSDLHQKLVETGDGYSQASLSEETGGSKDFYVTDSLYRTQSIISLLLSGYGLYSDKIYTNTSKAANHPKITGTYNIANQTIVNTGSTNSSDNVTRDKLYDFSVNSRKRFLSGPLPSKTCNNCDLLSLRLTNGDEITPKENAESAYRWVGPSTHFLMEPNTKDIWRYIVNDKPLNSIRSAVKGRNEFSIRSESFASAGAGLGGSVKTYLHNGIKDGTDLSSNIFAAIGCAYEVGDFYENRPSFFALARGYDISRNKETFNLTCNSLESDKINCNYRLNSNTANELIYEKLDGTQLDIPTQAIVNSKSVEIKRFEKSMREMVNNLCEITPATDKAPLHLTDHHFTTLAADEELNSALNSSPDYNNAKYLRLQTDMKDYISSEMTLLDLTGVDDAISEKRVGGAMVEAMYYIDDLSSSTIRIFYPTPLRDEFVRPDKPNGMVAVAGYVSDTCKGYGPDAAITGITRYTEVKKVKKMFKKTLFHIQSGSGPPLLDLSANGTHGIKFTDPSGTFFELATETALLLPSASLCHPLPDFSTVAQNTVNIIKAINEYTFQYVDSNNVLHTNLFEACACDINGKELTISEYNPTNVSLVAGMIIKYPYDPADDNYAEYPKVEFNSLTAFSNTLSTNGGGGSLKFLVDKPHVNFLSNDGIITKTDYNSIYITPAAAEKQMGYPSFADTSFNDVTKGATKGPGALLQNYIYGRGGIISKKRQSILELVNNLPGWRDGKIPLKDTSGGELLKAFIENPFKNATSGATITNPASGCDPIASHLRKGRSFAENPNLNLTAPNMVDKTQNEINAIRYSNMSVLTITGVRDFAFLKNRDTSSKEKMLNLFNEKKEIQFENSETPYFYKKNIYSRIGSILLPGTNKRTKYVIANHEQDREALSKSILKNLGMGNMDDFDTENYAIKGTPFRVKMDTDMNSYYLEAEKVPGFIASKWNKVQACMCAPSMSSRETGNYDIEIHPGQKFRANFGVIIKQKTQGIEGIGVGLSASARITPLEYTIKIHTIKSPVDVASENSGNPPNIKPSDLYGIGFKTGVIDEEKGMKINLMLRSVAFDETEIMNYYKLNTIIFLDEGSSGENYREVSKFITNMPENLTQYLGYMNRTVTAFLQEYPSNGYVGLGRSRYGIDNTEVNIEQQYKPGARNYESEILLAKYSTHYSADQLYFESNLIDVRSLQNDFDKQLMAWNEGIVGAKIGDMQLQDFDNISAEQVVDTSETLTEIPGFHILMWTEIRTLDNSMKNTISKKVITQDHLDEQKGYLLSSGKDGLSRGLYDDINFSLYEQNLLVKKGALTIQNEQIINNRNPVVQALGTRGQISPERKYEYGVYKENMWLSMYKNSAASNINIPIINEMDTVTHPDSIGLNTSHCERHGIKKSMGVLVLQHANVLYENHAGINFSIPSSLKNINQALNNENKLSNNEELVFCMCAVPENNNQVSGKTGVNPANSALLNIIVNDRNIGNTVTNQWGLCYDEIKIRSEATLASEFENKQTYKDASGNNKTYNVDRDIHYNMIIDLFRSKNTTKVRPLMIFNKLPRIEQVKRALELNCRPSIEYPVPDYPLGEYAPFLSTGFPYARNVAIISRLKYHTDYLNNLLPDASGMTGSEGYYYGAPGDVLRDRDFNNPPYWNTIPLPTWVPHRTSLGKDNDRETLLDLFYIKNELDSSSNMFTVTKLDAERKVESQEMNGCNSYTGGHYGVNYQHDLNEVPLYADVSSNQMSLRDGVLKSDICGNILHHYRYLNSNKSGVTGMWVETLIYFTSLLSRPLLNGEDNLNNVFWKVKDVRAGEWTRMPPELKDVSKHFEDKMRSYRKCLVSTLINSKPDTPGAFCTEIITRRPPAAWKENGKLYNAFPQVEFCATFRNQLIDKSFTDSEGAVKLVKNLAKFPLYCYLDENKQNIIFPSWTEEGLIMEGKRQMVYEEKIDYNFALDYYGHEFIKDLLDPIIGFGFNATTPFKRVQEYNNRLIESNKLYVKGSAGAAVSSGSKAVLDEIFDTGGTLESAADDLPRTLGGENGYFKKLGLIQMWVPFFEILFELKKKLSIKNPQGNQMSAFIQPDVIIGSHVNTFKNKFDIQNFQLKLNTVRLDINLLKECTAFEIKEIEFSDNTLLTLDTINPVGNAQSLFLPILIKTKEEKVETVKSRKVELKTDYLLETLNKMDVMSLMNNIWYRIDEEGNRIVLSPTELARVPLFRNNPGIMFTNDYEPILKHKLTKGTTRDEMVLETLRHVDGGEVRGVDPGKTRLADDRTWSGMGWCLKGIGQRLGFTGGHLDISGRNQQDTVTAQLKPGSTAWWKAGSMTDWFIEEFGLLSNKENGFDASGSSLFGGANANSKGASASSVWGAHRQHLHPTQNTGGFVRSAWLAERLATIVFGKQDFPSFNIDTRESGNIPFNDKMGSGTGGVLTTEYNKKHYQKSEPLMTIIADSEFGRLKLAKVRQDDSARGQLRDYRYPGKKFDYDYNVPIFAESVPNTNGTFACQIIRMIKSGLVGRPEDNKILINEQSVIDQINGGVYMAFSNSSSFVHKSLYSHLPENFTDISGRVDTNMPGKDATNMSPFNNVVMNPQQFMYLKLQEKKVVNKSKPYQGGFVPMQYVLQQLLTNDPQRFILNEKEADRHGAFTQKGGKDFNKTYKQWRVGLLDSGLPPSVQLMKADDREVSTSTGSTVSVSATPKKLAILNPVGRFGNWAEPSEAQKNEPLSAHPLALCIRGLDLDHCVMTYKDLSNNTLTATARDPEGEFLKGLSSDTPVQSMNDFNEPISNAAYAANHTRDVTQNVLAKKISKYGPALHLTEGNSPMRHDNTSMGRHRALKWDGMMLPNDNDYWGMTENMMMDTSGNGIAGWNSYIEHTDLTKTYPIYMLPLMDTDTLSIIVTNEGSLKDPLEISSAAEKNFTEVLKDITAELRGWSDEYTSPKNKLNINNTQGMGNVPGQEYGIDDPDGIMPETIEGTVFDDFPSITGHGINNNGSTPVPSISKGLYYDSINLLIAPELGPYEKLKVLEWRSKNFTLNEDGSPTVEQTNSTHESYGKGRYPLNGAQPNAPIYHFSGIPIEKDYQGLNINGQTSAFVFGDDAVLGWGSPENANYMANANGQTPQDCDNSLEAYYSYLGMNNKVNPGGSGGAIVQSIGHHTGGSAGPTWNTRANYLAVTLSNEELETYYQKFVTRSFTIKYKLDDSGDKHKNYNDIRISQLSADQVSAFEVKDDISLPKKDINDPDNHLRFEYENYKFFWDEATTISEEEKDQNDVDQMMVAKPLLLSSMFTENFKAQGSILIPRRFDGRPMDPNIPAQNIICIRKDNMVCVDKVGGTEIKSPTQKQIASLGKNDQCRFSLDIGLPMQGGGLIRCKIPLEAAGEDSFAFFLDPEYNRDYLVFKVRDWVGNEKTTGGLYPTIRKQNIIQNLHDALQRSQVAQLNERLLEPYTSAIATKYQPPPNTAFQMPVLLPSKPGGANIKIDGIVQQKTFFQPLNLILNPVAGGENHFEIKPINDSYYIRISANNFNWTNYMQQARLSVPRATFRLTASMGLTDGSLSKRQDVYFDEYNNDHFFQNSPHSNFPDYGSPTTQINQRHQYTFNVSPSDKFTQGITAPVGTFVSTATDPAKFGKRVEHDAAGVVTKGGYHWGHMLSPQGGYYWYIKQVSFITGTLVNALQNQFQIDFTSTAIQHPGSLGYADISSVSFYDTGEQSGLPLHSKQTLDPSGLELFIGGYQSANFSNVTLNADSNIKLALNLPVEVWYGVGVTADVVYLCFDANALAYANANAGVGTLYTSSTVVDLTTATPSLSHTGKIGGQDVVVDVSNVLVPPSLGDEDPTKLWYSPWNGAVGGYQTDLSDNQKWPARQWTPSQSIPYYQNRSHNMYGKSIKFHHPSNTDSVTNFPVKIAETIVGTSPITYYQRGISQPHSYYYTSGTIALDDRQWQEQDDYSSKSSSELYSNLLTFEQRQNYTAPTTGTTELTIQIDMWDTYGDGWNGSKLYVGDHSNPVHSYANGYGFIDGHLETVEATLQGVSSLYTIPITLTEGLWLDEIGFRISYKQKRYVIALPPTSQGLTFSTAAGHAVGTVVEQTYTLNGVSVTATGQLESALAAGQITGSFNVVSADLTAGAIPFVGSDVVGGQTLTIGAPPSMETFTLIAHAVTIQTVINPIIEYGTAPPDEATLSPAYLGPSATNNNIFGGLRWSSITGPPGNGIVVSGTPTTALGHPVVNGTVNTAAATEADPSDMFTYFGGSGCIIPQEAALLTVNLQPGGNTTAPDNVLNGVLNITEIDFGTIADGEAIVTWNTGTPYSLNVGDEVYITGLTGLPAVTDLNGVHSVIGTYGDLLKVRVKTSSTTLGVINPTPNTAKLQPTFIVGGNHVHPTVLQLPPSGFNNYFDLQERYSLSSGTYTDAPVYLTQILSGLTNQKPDGKDRQSIQQGFWMPALRPGDLVKQEYSGAIGQVTKKYNPRFLLQIKQKPIDTFEFYGNIPHYFDRDDGQTEIVTLVLEMFDSYGDGWDVGTVTIDGNVYTLLTGSFDTITFEVDANTYVGTNTPIPIEVYSGYWASEMSFQVTTEAGVVVYSHQVPGASYTTYTPNNAATFTLDIGTTTSTGSSMTPSFAANSGAWTNMEPSVARYIEEGWPAKILWDQMEIGNRIIWKNDSVQHHIGNIFFKNDEQRELSLSNTQKQQGAGNNYREIYVELVPGVENSAWGNILSGDNTYLEVIIKPGISIDDENNDVYDLMDERYKNQPLLLKFEINSNSIEYSGAASLEVRQMNDISFNQNINKQLFLQDVECSDYTFLIQNVDIKSGGSRGGDLIQTETTFGSSDIITKPCITNDPQVFFEEDEAVRKTKLVGRYFNIWGQDMATPLDYGHDTRVQPGDLVAHHPQFGTMNGGNGEMDLSAVIHDVRQSQLTGYRHDGKNNLWNTNPQRSTIYSLDLLALLNTTYDGFKWTHRTAPTLPNGVTKRVEVRDVILMSDFNKSIKNMELAVGNTRDKIGTPILVVSDIGKGWVDYEGTMMSRDRYFRLCEILGDPSDNYAIAMDDLGSTDSYHGDLDRRGDRKGFYGKYFLEGAAPWDLSGNLSNTFPDGSTTVGNFHDVSNCVEKLNNPIQHLHYGGYTTLDDPTTGAGCVGFPNADRLKSESKWNGGNHRKQYRLAFSTKGERTLPVSKESGKLTGKSKVTAFFPHWSASNPTGQQSAYHPVSTGFVNLTGFGASVAGTLPIDAMRMVHPSKYVFDPKLNGEVPTALVEQENLNTPWSYVVDVSTNYLDPWDYNSTVGIGVNGVVTNLAVDPSQYGIWMGGAKDRNSNPDTGAYYSNYDSEPFTMEYIAYRHQPIGHNKYHNNDWRSWHTSFSAKTRKDKDSKFLNVTPMSKYYKTGSSPKSDKLSLLSNDASLVWEDINGVSEFSQGDGYVDNSRYRWAGSHYCTHGGKLKALFGDWQAEWVHTSSVDYWRTVTHAPRPNHYSYHSSSNNSTFIMPQTTENMLTPGQVNGRTSWPALSSAGRTRTNPSHPQMQGENIFPASTMTIGDFSTLYNHMWESGQTNTAPSGINVACKSLLNECVDTSSPIRFELCKTTQESGNTSKAWMTSENQKRYYDHIKFFTTKQVVGEVSDRSVDGKLERDELRQAPSERGQFKSDKTGIEGLE